MAAKPYMTSDDIIASVKRKISFPTSQVTFTDEEILDFANEEMFIAQVPSVLQYHEEFFVTNQDEELIANKLNYTIPDRAIGMKLRDLFWKDTNGNLYEMARINPEDKAYFQRDFNTGRQPYPYYLAGNEVVLASTNLPNPTGNLTFSFFLRPNQLVANDNAAIIQSFFKTLDIVNADLVAGSQLILTTNTGTQEVYTATLGAPSTGQFQIGGTNAITAGNLVTVINNESGLVDASNANALVTLTYSNINISFTTNAIDGFNIEENQGINFDQIPSNITNNVMIDFLQTKPGHRILRYEIEVPTNGISGLTITFEQSDVPSSLIVGDYICLANTSIIPYLPPDLHNVLAERTAARILSAIGDLENLGAVQNKIKEMELNQGMLLDNRIEGRPQKVMNRHSLLHYGKRLIIRRF